MTEDAGSYSASLINPNTGSLTVMSDEPVALPPAVMPLSFEVSQDARARSIAAARTVAIIRLMVFMLFPSVCILHGYRVGFLKCFAAAVDVDGDLDPCNVAMAAAILEFNAEAVVDKCGDGIAGLFAVDSGIRLVKNADLLARFVKIPDLVGEGEGLDVLTALEYDVALIGVLYGSYDQFNVEVEYGNAQVLGRVLGVETVVLRRIESCVDREYAAGERGYPAADELVLLTVAVYVVEGGAGSRGGDETRCRIVGDIGCLGLGRTDRRGVVGGEVVVVLRTAVCDEARAEGVVARTGDGIERFNRQPLCGGGLVVVEGELCGGVDGSIDRTVFYF